ncbi:MAG: MetQ/NlpA family ABC transporter substrate-binding protein [Coriobacteriales bacterium]
MKIANSITRRALVLGASAALVASLGLAGCGASSNANSGSSEAPAEDKTITVAAVPTPHAEILKDVVAPLLEAQGYTLDVVEFSDYIQPNVAVTEGAADANYFQHQPYLDSYNEENGTDLVSVRSVHYEPFGLYAGSKSSLDELAKGDKVAVPNDTTNEARALLLLEQAGLIEVDDAAGITATPKDITSNPLGLEFVELEAAQIPRSLEDVAIAAINSNYAIEAGLNPAKDALEIEDPNGTAAQTYANLLVTSPDLANDPKILALADALNSDEVRDYINNTYDGAVLPIF